MNEKKITFPWEDLLNWHEGSGRHDLPWRDYSLDENNRVYRVWLSEIFLQQTQVSRVIGYFQQILKRYPTLSSLALTDYETFFPYYQGLGYYSRARNILKTAQILKKDYDGVFPREKSLLMKLPGVGEYTAHAILAFAFGEAYLAWDTNLEKVFSRYYHGRKDIELSKEEKLNIEEDFKDFLQSESSPVDSRIRTINNALMDFAALIDLKNPHMIDWASYPIQSGKFYETRGGLEPNEVKKSVSFPTPDATIIITLHENHTRYFSQDTDTYTPFSLPPPLYRDIRKYVQEYFREKYSLELSVRPPHKKWIDLDGKPFLAVNAQIQKGTYPFEVYKKTGDIFGKL